MKKCKVCNKLEVQVVIRPQHRTCNTCEKAKTRTKEGLTSFIYKGQRGSSRKRGHSYPTYTKQELHAWLYSQKLFHELYDNWVADRYCKNSKPSVDRIDDTLGYKMTNIQLMTWRENRNKSFKDKKSGKLKTKRTRAVKQYTKDGIFIAEFFSITDASRITGARSDAIGAVCLGKKNRHTTGGFRWKFA